MNKRIESIRVEAHSGDITEFDVDAVVNAANSDLWMGSGVAGAIKRKGGQIIEDEAMAQGPIKPGQAVLTSGGKLKALHVIHCAGMPPEGRATSEFVESSVRVGLELAIRNELTSVAIPAIGAGVGGLSYRESVEAVLHGVRAVSETPGTLERLILVAYGTKALETLNIALNETG